MTTGAGQDRDVPHVLVLYTDVDLGSEVGRALVASPAITVALMHRPLSALELVDALTADAVVVVEGATIPATDERYAQRARNLARLATVVVFRRPFAGDADPLAPFVGLTAFIETTAGAVSDAFVDRVVATAEATRDRRRRGRPGQAVLAVGAHPDDVELGVGGTLAAHVHAGDEVAILTMSRGARGGASSTREREAQAAAAVVGARLFLEDLPDTEFPDGGDTVRRIEAVVREVNPAIVYVHSLHDRHQDHRAVHHATRVAARQVPTLAAYQSPSSTVEFQPTEFVSIDAFMAVKLEMLAAFGSQETRPYLDPDVVRTTASYWSRFTGGGLVEPLEVLRTNLTVTPTGRTDLLSGAPSGDVR